MRILLFQNETWFHLETDFWPFMQWLKNIFISILLYNSRIQNPAVFFLFAGKAFVLIVHVRTLIIKVYHSNRKKYELPYIDRNRVFRSYKRK